MRHAREVDRHAWLEEGDWTPCRLTGRLTTSDGRPYDFELDQGGRARLTITASVSVYLLGEELPLPVKVGPRRR